MKKLLGISLVTVLAVSPMMASAAGLNEEPKAITDPTVIPAQSAAAVTAGSTSPVAAGHKPKYALKEGNTTTDVKPATAGYVKGAYNAAIKGINALHDNATTLDSKISGPNGFASRVGSYADSVAHFTDGYADQDSFVDLIQDDLSATVAINSSNFNALTGFTSVTGTATASGALSLAMDVMDNWETDTVNQSAITTEASFSGVSVSSIALSVGEATTSGTLTKSGITVDLDVDAYHAS